jgi:hypothetical protein
MAILKIYRRSKDVVFIEAMYFGLNADYTRAGRDRKVTEGIAGTELWDRGSTAAIHPGGQSRIFRSRP